MVEISFGEWLRRQRGHRALTQEQLAQQIGCAAITLRKIESEERRASAQIVERLAEIFNIPSNERKTFLRFARGDWISAPHVALTEVPWQTSAPFSRSNLPATVTSLIGREKEIADVCEYLLSPNIRLVSLIGPPGIGKTRLSIESAHTLRSYFADGVFFVALAPLDDPAQIAITVAQSLGYVGTRNIATHEQLTTSIGEKQMLIVLDNCEHLIEDVALLVSSLLSACSRIKILATSRESLRVVGEWLYTIPGLESPNESSSVTVENISEFPALALFAERARAVRSDFRLGPENIQTVAAICAHLDGLPLVIELIAARLRLMSTQSLLERLNDRFILSADGMRAASTRQKTLSNAIHWSYNLLSTEEQELFARLSVFSGGFTLDAAKTIFFQTVAEKPVTDLIASLLDKSLLQRISSERGDPLYSMLVTIREFARERLQIMGEETKIRNWHLAYFLDLAERGNQEIHGPAQIEWLSRLHAMRDNLRVALEWAMETQQTELALQLARNLHWFWFMRGDFVGARHWFKRVLDMPDTSLYPEAETEALIQLAHHNLQLGEKAVQEARPFVEQALSIVGNNHDERNRDSALGMLGQLLTEERNFAEAQSILEESKMRFQESHNHWEYAHTLLCLAVLSQRQEHWPSTLTLSKQALAEFQKLGDKYFQSVAFRLVGRACVYQDDLRNGMAALQDALILAQQLDNKFQIALVLWRSFSEAALRSGRTVQRYMHTLRALGLVEFVSRRRSYISWHE